MPPFLSEFLSADDLYHILSITTLNISLRLELIKFFRMIYIDLSIDLNKLEQYRYNFQQELDADVAEVGDSLIPKIDTLDEISDKDEIPIELSDYSSN